MNNDDPIVEVSMFHVARNAERTVHVVLEAVLESGATVELFMTEEAAARAYLLIGRVGKDLGWQLRDAAIEENKIH
jgi:hypothetical protein